MWQICIGSHLSSKEGSLSLSLSVHFSLSAPNETTQSDGFRSCPSTNGDFRNKYFPLACLRPAILLTQPNKALTTSCTHSPNVVVVLGLQCVRWSTADLSKATHTAHWWKYERLAGCTHLCTLTHRDTHSRAGYNLCHAQLWCAANCV